MFPVLDRRLQVTSRLSTFAAVAAALSFSLRLPSPSRRRRPRLRQNALPPRPGVGDLLQDRPRSVGIDGGPAANKPAFKELRLDNQSGALNSFVRVGPSTNGQGQGSAESRSNGSGSSGTSSSGTSSSGAGSPNERRSPELFKLGGNVKF